jgi:hypothetical protein
MKTLHLTSHSGTRRNIENVFNYLNMNCDLVTESSINGGFYISKEYADDIWLYYQSENKLHEYKCLFFTDTTMIARPFLQNIDKHNLFIIVYITNRFDWGFFGNKDEDYLNLYSEISKHDRVVFCSDNNYDQYYAKYHGIQFLYDKCINLTPYLCDKIHLQQPDKNKFFIYNRGTKIDDYQNYLKNHNIEFDVFGPDYTMYRDSEEICEYKGFIHLPYQVNIQSLWENLGYYIIYFIPSKKFIKELLLTESWYYWEEKERKQFIEESIDLSEWYIDENACLFEYFDSWDDLELKSNKVTQEYLIEKKQTIQNFMTNNNDQNLIKWKHIFSIIN